MASSGWMTFEGVGWGGGRVLYIDNKSRENLGMDDVV